MDRKVKKFNPDSKINSVELDFILTPPPHMRQSKKATQSITGVLEADLHAQRYYYQVEAMNVVNSQDIHLELMSSNENGLEKSNLYEIVDVKFVTASQMFANVQECLSSELFQVYDIFMGNILQPWSCFGHVLYKGFDKLRL
ncbi:unnamed protein product [Owenia fusiformis]|uniref:Uncharacterized protein n=1 Tax=Owenia fusiformis TaxID=6347 RepID=A0A8S4NXE1_OWEFU|nr:unnamed protein product [Owenia fusiformis]